MPGKANPVTLPAAAGNRAPQAAESVPDGFLLIGTDIQVSAPAALAPEDLPPQAKVPENVPPTDVPPVVELPEQASHMSETAVGNLPAHVQPFDLLV
jgi:hypothetical protein